MPPTRSTNLILRACVSAGALLAVCVAQGETLDRLAVTVGRHVITESDVLLDLRVAAFLDGRTPDHVYFAGLAVAEAA